LVKSSMRFLSDMPIESAAENIILATCVRSIIFPFESFILLMIAIYLLSGLFFLLIHQAKGSIARWFYSF